MKKHLALALGILITGSMAQAGFPGFQGLPFGQDVRLEVRTAPRSAIKGYQSDAVLVLSNGQVVREVRDSKTNDLVKSAQVTTLSASEMNHIDELIEAARNGKIVTETSQIHCMAISLNDTTYTADNGKVFLLKSSVCQDPTENTAPEAKELVSQLSTLEKQANAIQVTEVRCTTYPRIYDGGYNVNVTEDLGGNDLVVSIGVESIAGEHNVGSIYVEKNEEGQKVTYTDPFKKGGTFTLTVDRSNVVKTEEGEAYLSSFSYDGSPQNASADGQLACVFPQN